MHHMISAGRRLKGLVLGTALAALLLAGCAAEPPAPTETTSPAPTQGTVQETVPPTTPPDGTPGTITARGTYTDTGAAAAANTVVATAGEETLTNSLLQVYYRMEAAAWQEANPSGGPDFSKPLDTQLCDIDQSVVTWQQYFLKRALNTWHTSQALVLQGEAEGLPLEEAYMPNQENHEEYMTDMPALKVLYGYNKSFVPNQLHQAYLDSLEGMLTELAKHQGFADGDGLVQAFAGSSTKSADLLAYAQVYNRAYMYYTNLSYYLEPTDEDILAYREEHLEYLLQAGLTEDSGNYIDIRQILILPEGTVAADGTVTATEEQWEKGLYAAQAIRREYDATIRRRRSIAHPSTPDAWFAALANQKSQDAGTALDGGLYRGLSQGQLIPELDIWVFDPARQQEDVEVLRSPYGYHIVYIRSIEPIWYAETREALLNTWLEDLILKARETYPMEVDYSSIRLDTPAADASLSPNTLLYADVAHQRYPVAPLYLQQDYPDTMYGNYKITSHGCGITTMAMLASYMADDELTPPEMCARYGEYCYPNGTDGIFFVTAPPEMGFYLKERTFQPQIAKEAMEQGYVVVCVQRKGYWTRGGHYLLLEEMFEDGTIQVRDSNIFNYGRLEKHREDRFPWTTVPPSACGYWIFENKITAIPACSRCGDPQGTCDSMVQGDYTCEKCIPALRRRSTFLTLTGEEMGTVIPQ